MCGMWVSFLREKNRHIGDAAITTRPPASQVSRTPRGSVQGRSQELRIKAGKESSLALQKAGGDFGKHWRGRDNTQNQPGGEGKGCSHLGRLVHGRPGECEVLEAAGGRGEGTGQGVYRAQREGRGEQAQLSASALQGALELRRWAGL